LDERVYWAHWLMAEYRLDRLRKDARFDKLLNRLEREKIKNVPISRFGQRLKKIRSN
jgi:ribosome assembly protein YihI (activator of Der GTPase)